MQNQCLQAAAELDTHPAGAAMEPSLEIWDNSEQRAQLGCPSPPLNAQCQRLEKVSPSCKHSKFDLEVIEKT